MKQTLSATAVRVGLFVLIMSLAMFALITIFGQFRFGGANSYSAEFSDVTGLSRRDFVRIAGVEVGQVQRLSLNDNGTVKVDFTADHSVALTEGTRAVIRWDNVIGGRYLALEEGAGGTKLLAHGSAIPLSQTAPALDLDALIQGFRPLFRALDPEQVNILTSQLVGAFQGQGVTVGSLLDQTAMLTDTLADRDMLIGEVITNLNTVLGSLGDSSQQFGQAIDSLAELVHGLAERKEDIGRGIRYANAATASIGRLFQQGRAPVQRIVSATDQVSNNLLAQKEDLEYVLEQMPESVRVLNRQALNGDYFSFYFCEVVLKLNGKGGQPMYVKVAGQPSGRCTPQ